MKALTWPMIKLINPSSAKPNERKPPMRDALWVQTAAEAVGGVEPDDLSRFEGEGGPEAPLIAAEWTEVQLENAIWRKPYPAAQQEQGNLCT